MPRSGGGHSLEHATVSSAEARSKSLHLSLSSIARVRQMSPWLCIIMHLKYKKPFETTIPYTTLV